MLAIDAPCGDKRPREEMTADDLLRLIKTTLREENRTNDGVDSVLADVKAYVEQHANEGGSWRQILEGYASLLLPPHTLRDGGWELICITIKRGLQREVLSYLFGRYLWDGGHFFGVSRDCNGTMQAVCYNPTDDVADDFAGALEEQIFEVLSQAAIPYKGSYNRFVTLESCENQPCKEAFQSMRAQVLRLLNIEAATYRNALGVRVTSTPSNPPKPKLAQDETHASVLTDLWNEACLTLAASASGLHPRVLLCTHSRSNEMRNRRALYVVEAHVELLVYLTHYEFPKTDTDIASRVSLMKSLVTLLGECTRHKLICVDMKPENLVVTADASRMYVIDLDGSFAAFCTSVAPLCVFMVNATFLLLHLRCFHRPPNTGYAYDRVNACIKVLLRQFCKFDESPPIEDELYRLLRNDYSKAESESAQGLGGLINCKNAYEMARVIVHTARDYASREATHDVCKTTIATDGTFNFSNLMRVVRGTPQAHYERLSAASAARMA